MFESLEKNLQVFEAIEPGSAKMIQKYLDSAEDAYRLASRHFLYTNFKNLKSFTHPEVVARAGRFIKHLLTSLHAFSSKL